MTQPEILKHESTRSLTQDVIPNSKNDSIVVGLRDGLAGKFNLVLRSQAVVSVFDSNFLIGAGFWEGVRANKGRVQFAKEHIKRLFQAAKAMFMDLGITKTDLLTLLHETLDTIDMNDESREHIRLVVSRGVKSTPYQNPNVNVGLPLIVVVPEIKGESIGQDEKPPASDRVGPTRPSRRQG